MTHICVRKVTIISSGNCLPPGRHQVIIWTNARILLIRISGTNFSEISSEIQMFSFKKNRLKCLSAKWRQFYLGHDVLLVKCHRQRHNVDSRCGQKPSLTNYPLEYLDVYLKARFSVLIYWFVSSDLFMIMPSGECHITLMMRSQHWCR